MDILHTILYNLLCSIKIDRFRCNIFILSFSNIMFHVNKLSWDCNIKSVFWGETHLIIIVWMRQKTKWFIALMYCRLFGIIVRQKRVSYVYNPTSNTNSKFCISNKWIITIYNIRYLFSYTFSFFDAYSLISKALRSYKY